MIMNKLLNKKGETIVETLAAILIVALCFVMLQNSIVTAAKINNSTENNQKSFVVSTKSRDTSDDDSIKASNPSKYNNCHIELYINDKNVDTNSNKVDYWYDCFLTDNGEYVYYEHYTEK